jgi:NAD+ kinase
MNDVPSSPNGRGDLKAAGIRLRKAYDNVTVNETLSDPRIQLAPTTHKDVTLEWDSPPTTVLIIKKRQEPGITELLKSMAIWLQEEKNIKVLVEPSVTTELPELTSFCIEDPSRYPDIVICLGGDGTVLHANTLFQNSMPPVMAFSLGSLGFLTPFRVRKYKQSISGVLNQCKVTLRSRLFCVIVKVVDGKEQVTRRTVLNEVVVDRGYSPYLSNLECFCDNVPITNIQADGIIVSSTTGSTAYSLSAGGSMVHPQMPAILFTPICPHSLSFRPLIFPDSVELKIQVPDDSRSTAWASFDGREQTELHRGDHLIIRVSKWPFVWIRDSDGVGDWFKSLADCLHWNDRRKQKPVANSTAASSSNLGASPSNA